MLIQNHLNWAVKRTSIENGGELIHACEWSELAYDIIVNAEKFLIRSLSSSSKCTHFDDLRYNVSTWQEILIWLRLVSGDQRKHEVAHSTCTIPGLLVEPYVFCRSNITDSRRVWKCGGWNRTVEASYSECIKLPNDFPVPRNCSKCARENVCQHCVKQVACCQFCKCEGVRGCRSPANTQS